MTIPQLEAFLILAENLNYTKASGLLHTTQPNLSRIIMNIEQEVGVQLFTRSNRDVRLTPAGAAFQAETIKLMEQYARSIEQARGAESGIHGILRIGFLGTAFIRRLPRIAARFRREYPDILLHLTDYTYTRLTQAFLEENVDIALMPDRELQRHPNINRKLLFADDMCLVVPCGHPQSAENRVDLSAMSGEAFILMDQKISVRDHELVTNMCIEQDFMPHIAYEANTLNNLIMMVECGIGVSVLAKHMEHFATENVRFIPIIGYEGYFRISCAWRKGGNPCTPRFLEVVEACKSDGELDL